MEMQERLLNEFIYLVCTADPPSGVATKWPLVATPEFIKCLDLPSAVRGEEFLIGSRRHNGRSKEDSQEESQSHKV